MAPLRPVAAGRAAPVEDVWVLALEGGSVRRRPDRVAGEEPLEIRLAGAGQEAEPVAVTMRTPGNDFELAVGFLLSEGLLESGREVQSVRYCDLPDDDPQQYNVVTVSSRNPVDLTGRRRDTTVSASCGVCGTASLEQLQRRCPAVPDGERISAQTLEIGRAHV